MAGLPVVAVFLGTDHHPFDRLVSWVAELARDERTTWYVQHGATTLPAGLEGSSMLSSAGMQALLQRADVVVTHGGPGLIMEARAAGHLPIVVPRDPALHEHVDDHQQRFVRRIAASDLAVTASSPETLRAAVGTRLLVGRSGLGRAGGSAAAATRIGFLVDALVRRG